MSQDPIDRLNAALSGRYLVEGRLGEGGMATVYLADDLKHERKVAVKVLRPELAALIGGDRFLTEIKTTAALQHPHILPLFDSGEADGFLYYVMPYVDGASLRGLLDQERQLDVSEALRITKAVASALGYAHDRDIIHRDIKPENILMHAGQPVVADFGIALAISAAGGGRLTETGLSLGTPHYMSPEQASADRELSARSDVYSLGCMLYEMLAGQPPHTGPTAQSILVRILTEDARSLTELRHTVPPHVAAVVAKAIEKLPADRFKSAGDFASALDDEGFRWEPVRRPRTETAVRATAAEAAGEARPWDLRTKAFAGLAALLALVAGAQFFGGRGREPLPEGAPVISFVLDDQAESMFAPAVAVDGSVALHRDGVLHVRRSGSLAEEALPAASGIQTGLDFSPDGQWIVYASGSGPSTLAKIPTAGGPVVTLATFETGFVFDPDWGDDGWIYGNILEQGLVFRVPEVGGPVDTLFVSGSQLIPFGVETLPGGRHVLLSVGTGTGQRGRIVALDVDSGDTATVVDSGFSPRWSPTGHLVYAHVSRALFAVPFDLRTPAATGPPVPVLDGLGIFGEAIGRFDLSPAGTLIYIRGGAVMTGADLAFGLLDPSGAMEALPLEPTDHQDADFSGDGRFLAYTRGGMIWVYDMDRGSNRNVTEGFGTEMHNPRWSPDGTEIAFRATRDSVTGIWAVPAQGGTPRPVAPGGPYNTGDWLDDGTILFSSQNPSDIGRVSAQGGEVEWLLEADWEEVRPTVSPDGRWLAYHADEGGSMGVWVRSWPELTQKTLISDGPVRTENYIVWSPDGETLYYTGASNLVAASLEVGEGLRVTDRKTVSVPSPLFLLSAGHPDGRLLLHTVGSVEEGEEGAGARLVAVTNWFTELRRRVGPDG